MQELNKKIKELREFFNNSTITKSIFYNDGSSHIVNAAFDIIDDTCIAINSYLSLSEEEYSKSSYLLTYGLFQCLFVQQDAVNDLHKKLLGEKINIETGQLKLIRESRNAATGHPTGLSRDGIKKSIVISRISLRKDGFKYDQRSEVKSGMHDVNTIDCINAQEKELIKYLDNIMDDMKEKEQAHKSKFKDKLLVDLLDPLNEHPNHRISNVLDTPFGESILNTHREVFDSVHTGIKERYGEDLIFAGIPRVVLTLEEVKQGLDGLSEIIKNNKDNASEKYKRDAEVYGYYMENKFLELKEQLVGIDKKVEI